MIKIEFPSDRKDIALAIGQALTAIGQGAALANTPAPAPAGVPPQIIAPVGSQPAEPVAVNDYEGDKDVAPTSGDSSRVDEKGVAYNPQMCANAAKPFYASGKTKGQWKKKGGENGPTEAEYDAWYAAALAAVTTVTKTDAPQADVDVSKVWNAAAAPANAGPKAPTNPGELFAWISEMQAGGRLTQFDVDAAYPANNLSGSQLWTADPATQALMVEALYDTLAIKANA